jgi:serralysin
VFNSATRTFTWTPSYTQAGAYTVTFTVSDGQLTDSKTVPITVNNVVRADLIISALSSTAVTTSPGSVIAVLATVTNQGTLVAVSSRINFHLSVDAVYGGSNDVVISTNPSVASLNGGASRQITSSVTVPSSTGAGSYYLCGLSDSTARVTEENETNNALCAAVTIQVVLPDLVINAVSGPSSGARGQGIALQSTVANQGTGVAAISFNVGIYLSTDATITTADRRLSSTSVSSMLAGTTRAISTSAVVSTAVIPGTYYIGAIADYSLRAPENNETNNSRAGNVIVIQ